MSAGQDSGCETSGEGGMDSGCETSEESGMSAGQDSGCETSEESGMSARQDSGCETSEEGGMSAGQDSPPGGMSYAARRKGGRLHVQGRERNEFGGLYGYGGLGEWF